MVLERFERVDGQLHHRYRRLGEGMHQDRPGAVIDAPAVEVGSHPRRLDHVGDLVGERGQSGCRVLHVEEFRREPVEIVDRPRIGHRGDGGRVDVPVRADDENRPRAPEGFTHRLAERAPRRGIAVELEGVHRAAVPDEGCRHECGHASGPPSLGRARLASHFSGGGAGGLLGECLLAGSTLRSRLCLSP